MGFLGKLLRMAIVAVLLTLAGLTGYHWHQGGSVEGAVRMTVQDAQVALACLTRPDRFVQFVHRSNEEAERVGVAEWLGEEWVGAVCHDDGRENALTRRTSELAGP